MRNKIIQLIYVFCLLLVNDSYSQLSMIRDSIVRDYSSIVIDDPKFQIRLVGSIHNSHSDKSKRFKYFNKDNDSVVRCSYSYNSNVESIQIKSVNSNKDVYHHDCFIIKIETTHGEQLYFKDGIVFNDEVTFSILPEDMKYKIINGVNKYGYCGDKVFTTKSLFEKNYYVITIMNRYKTFLTGYVEVI